MTNRAAILEIHRWQTPATAYPCQQHGVARLARSRYRKGSFYHLYGLPEPTTQKTYDYCHLRTSIQITELRIENQVVMVDDPPHQYAMIEHAKQYHGHVLVAGLGLGLILHTLWSNPNVQHVTVIERCADVITLMQPLIKNSLVGVSTSRSSPVDDWLTILQADWHECFEPEISPQHGMIDGVFFDLLVGDGKSLIPHALRAMIDMKQRWPGARTFRVHGFDNQTLNQTVDQLLIQTSALQAGIQAGGT